MENSDFLPAILGYGSITAHYGSIVVLHLYRSEGLHHTEEVQWEHLVYTKESLGYSLDSNSP